MCGCLFVCLAVVGAVQVVALVALVVSSVVFAVASGPWWFSPGPALGELSVETDVRVVLQSFSAVCWVVAAVALLLTLVPRNGKRRGERLPLLGEQV